MFYYLFIIYLYVHYIIFNFVIYISIFILFDFKFVSYVQNCYNVKFLLLKKYLYFHDSPFLCYMNFFIIWFSHTIWLVKSGRQFVYEIL